jgi:hypothetical protein
LEQARLYIEEIDGLTKIEKLQDNENEDVYKSAFHMVEKFFSDEVSDQFKAFLFCSPQKPCDF